MCGVKFESAKGVKTHITRSHSKVKVEVKKIEEKGKTATKRKKDEAIDSDEDEVEEKKSKVDMILDISDLTVEDMNQVCQSTQKGVVENDEGDLTRIMNKHLGNENMVNETIDADDDEQGEKEPVSSKDTIHVAMNMSEATETDFDFANEINDTIKAIEIETTAQGKVDKIQNLMRTKDLQIESLRGIVKTREKVITEQKEEISNLQIKITQIQDEMDEVKKVMSQNEELHNIVLAEKESLEILSNNKDCILYTSPSTRDS